MKYEHNSMENALYDLYPVVDKYPNTRSIRSVNSFR